MYGIAKASSPNSRGWLVTHITHTPRTRNENGHLLAGVGAPPLLLDGHGVRLLGLVSQAQVVVRGPVGSLLGLDRPVWQNTIKKKTKKTKRCGVEEGGLSYTVPSMSTMR